MLSLNAYPEELIIQATVRDSLTKAETSLVASTPDINEEMLILLTEVNLFGPEMVGANGQLTADAKSPKNM